MLLLLLWWLVVVSRLEDGQFVVETKGHVIAGRRSAHVNVQNPRVQRVRRHVLLGKNKTYVSRGEADSADAGVTASWNAGVAASGNAEVASTVEIVLMLESACEECKRV